MGIPTIRRISVLNRLPIKSVKLEMDQSSAGWDFNDIDRNIRREMSGDARRLADAFSEFRETWLEPPNS
jgi:hypothetical protein